MRSLFRSTRLGWRRPPLRTNSSIPKKTRIPVRQPIRIRSRDRPRWRYPFEGGRQPWDLTVSRQVHRKAYNTNLRLRLHLHEVIVPIDTARLASPSLADELLHSEEDEDTSGTADTDPKQRQAKLTMSFRGRMVLLSVKSVVPEGIKKYGGGVAADSPSIHQSIDPSIHRSFDQSIHPSIDPLIHPSIHP